MDATEGLKHRQSGILDELAAASNQEEIVLQHLQFTGEPMHTGSNSNTGYQAFVCIYLFTFNQFLLGKIKVKVDIEALHKLCDGVSVGIGLLKENSGQPQRE